MSNVFCPHCGAGRTTSATDPDAPIPCFRCEREFTLRTAVKLEPEPPKRIRARPVEEWAPQRRNRTKSVAWLNGPTRILSVIAFFQSLIHLFLLQMLGWELVKPRPVNPEVPDNLILIFCVTALFFARDVTVVLGMSAMRQQRGYKLAVAGAVCALIPSPCWMLSALLGVWALVVLMRADVRAAFADKSREDTTPTPQSATVRAIPDGVPVVHPARPPDTTAP